jgi:hypothetical protein
MSINKIIQSLQKGGNTKKGRNVKRRALRESSTNFDRYATTTKRNSESYQELKQYVIVIFNELGQIQLSLRQPDNDADLAIRNNRKYLVKICRITNIARIFGFSTLFSLLCLNNMIRNSSYPFRIPIFQIQIVPIRKISRVQKILKVGPTVIRTRSFSVPPYCLPAWYFSFCDWCSNDMI